MENLLTSEKPKTHPEYLEREVLSEQKMQELMDNYGDELLRLCTLYLKDRYLAEDALQETYIKVWQKYNTYDALSEEKTWITRIAINVCKNYLRTAWIKKTEVKEVMEIVSGEKDSYNRVEDTIDVLNAILTLKDKYRMVLLLYYYQEFSVGEIAEIMDRKESTILSLLRRGRIQIRKILNYEWKDKEHEDEI